MIRLVDSGIVDLGQRVVVIAGPSVALVVAFAAGRPFAVTGLAAYTSAAVACTLAAATVGIPPEDKRVASRTWPSWAAVLRLEPRRAVDSKWLWQLVQGRSYLTQS